MTKPAIVYGAIDLGTNNCRLMMAVPENDQFRVLETFSRTTRLGEGLAKNGVLSEMAMKRSIIALQECASRLRQHEMYKVRVVATEACRRASNCIEFIDRVRTSTGLSIEIIDTKEEAALSLSGCSNLLEVEPGNCLVFDIGGGSTELIQAKIQNHKASIQRCLSLPLGVVTLTEQEDFADISCYQAIVTALEKQLARFDPDGQLHEAAKQGKLQMLGCAGTVTTLAAVFLNMKYYDRSRIDGIYMTFHEISAVISQLLDSLVDGRVAHPCIEDERADLVIAGCAILEAVCRRWPVGRLRIADRGVREGVLLSMLHETGEINGFQT